MKSPKSIKIFDFSDFDHFGRDPPNPQMSQHVARDLPTKIARHARNDGSILSIGRWNNSLERMEVWNGSHGLHLDLQTFEI